MTVAEILLAGHPIQFELLTDLPDTLDPASWKRLPWFAPPFLEAVPAIMLSQDGVAAEFSLEVIGQLNLPVTCNAFGARFQSTGIFVGEVSPFPLLTEVALRFQSRVIVNQWIS